MAFLLCGCGEIKVGVGPVNKPTLAAPPTSTPVVLPTTTLNEFVSRQDRNLTVRDIKPASSRVGKVIEGTIINRGSHEYGVVTITINCIDKQGKIVGSGRDAIQEFRPGDQRNFRTNVSSDSDNIRYEVSELRGY